MKRLYLIHESAWASLVHFQNETDPRPLWHTFNGHGCTWMDLDAGHRLVCGDFSNAGFEHVWNAHPAVVHFHHPEKEKALPIGDLLTSAHAHKRFTSAHMGLIKKGLGANESDTMMSLNDKIAAAHPGCCIYPIAAKSNLWLY